MGEASVDIAEFSGLEHVSEEIALCEVQIGCYGWIRVKSCAEKKLHAGVKLPKLVIVILVELDDTTGRWTTRAPVKTEKREMFR